MRTNHGPNDVYGEGDSEDAPTLRGTMDMLNDPVAHANAAQQRLQQIRGERLGANYGIRYGRPNTIGGVQPEEPTQPYSDGDIIGKGLGPTDRLRGSYAPDYSEGTGFQNREPLN